VTSWSATIRKQMGSRTRAIRLLAFTIAATLSWSLVATCVEGATSQPSAQMACCKNGHHTCRHAGTPADCCKTAPQAAQFTSVAKVAAPQPLLVFTHVAGSTSTAQLASWHPSPLSETWSPPGTKHPTYLRLSVLRL
jgi:hypothetical protein